MATDDGMQATRVMTFNTLLDEEGVRSEEIKRLRGSVSAFKGHLTRAYKEIRFLCSKPGPLSEIVSRKSALDDLFARYTAAVQSLLQNVVDIEEQDTIACCHRREADEKALFDEEFTKWFNSARQFISAESTRVSTPGVISTEVPRTTPLSFHARLHHTFLAGLHLSFHARLHARLHCTFLAGLHLSFHGRFHARPHCTFLARLHLSYKTRLHP